MQEESKPLVWLHGAIKTPPFSQQARLQCGYLLRCIQLGEQLGMPQCRPMSAVGTQCYELRVPDQDKNWRVMFHVGTQEIVILEVFNKTTKATPAAVIKTCKARLKSYRDSTL